MKTNLSIPVLAAYAVALYICAYALYWGAAWLIGSPHEFRNLWGKSLTLPAIAAAAYYFNKTNTPRGR